MNPLSVLITTWPNSDARLHYLRHVLQALARHLSATGRQLRYLVSAEHEGVDDWAQDELANLCAEFDAQLIWHADKANLGAHLNFAFAQCPDDIRLYVQDDWELCRALDLNAAAAILETQQSIAVVRFWVAHTKFAFPNGRWATVDKRGPWPIADNPHLSHRRWLETTGPYQEWGDAGWHENMMANQFAKCALNAIAPVEVVENPDYYFRHIGKVSAFKEKR